MVAIIAILALIVLLAINPVELKRRSNDSRRLSDIGTLRRAIDLSLADGKTLPGTAGTPVTYTTGAGGSILVASDATNNLVRMDISKYVSTIPQDPSYISGDTTTLQTTDGTGCTTTPGTASVQKQNMVYSFKSNGSVYFLSSHLESTDNCSAAAGDGNADALFETGTAPGLTL